jgi:2-polyprenyl-6-methoxyphenol hydroxylase-like FAD-dependent oxidoreductase
LFGCGQRFVLAHLDRDHAHWIAVANAPEGGLETDKSILLQRYRGWMHPVEEVIQATEDKAIRRMDVVDRDPVRRWGEGRVTLLGDAAHPLTWDLGQGSCQAIEDAVVLEKCLGATDDIVAGLRTYENRRRVRTALLVSQSRRIGWAASWENPAACRLRDQLLKLTWNRGLRLITEQVVMGYRA